MAVSQLIAPSAVFSRWMVVSLSEPDSNGARWKCRCECGAEKIVSAAHLRHGRSKSCGCLRHDAIVAENNSRVKHGHAVGGKVSPEYRVWRSMIWRCSPSNKKDGVRYYGRGIRICERWTESFGNFFADMGRRPGLKSTIERKDNDGPYAPWNCRWASVTEQSNNRRSNRLLTHDGRTQTMIQWAREYAMPYRTVFDRINSGWSIGKALTTPLRKQRRAAEKRIAEAARLFP